VDEDPASRKVRPFYDFHELAVVEPLALDQLYGCVDQLPDVVRGDRGGHSHGDSACTISEQVGEQPGEDLRFLFLAIVGGTKLDRALVEPGHELDCDRCEPRFG